MAIQLLEIKVGLGQLMLDPNNYRLNNGEEVVDFSAEEIVAAQFDTQERLVKENVTDLASSIRENGFLEVDKIVVKKLIGLDSVGTKYLVIEGNRRTSAFKSIMREISRVNDGGNKIERELREKSLGINVILVGGEEEEILDYSHRLMGIRHVSGPRQWGGFQGARLIDSMFKSKDYKEISSLLGMRPAETQRRHEAYLAFKQMQSDEKYKDRAHIKYFTLLSEFVASNKFCKEEWLGWNKASKKFENTKHLHLVYDAIVLGDNNKQELTNPSKARKFIRSLSKPSLRQEIEEGVPFSELSEHHWGSDKNQKRIYDFTKFISKVSCFEEQERLALKGLKTVIDRVLDGDRI